MYNDSIESLNVDHVAHLRCTANAIVLHVLSFAGEFSLAIEDAIISMT